MKRVYKRIISVVLALTVAVGSVCWRPPKAKAVVIDATAAFGAAAATAAINGTTATTLFSGMGTAAATNGIIIYMDAYAAATGVAASGAALASTIATGILVAGGTLLVGAAAAALIGGFIDWMREQEGLEPGSELVSLIKDNVLPLSDGSLLPLCSVTSFPNYNIVYDAYDFEWGTWYSHDYKSWMADGTTFYYKRANGSSDSFSFSYNTNAYRYCLYRLNDGIMVGIIRRSDNMLKHVTNFDTVNDMGVTVSSLDLQPKPEFHEIPQEIQEGQVLSIDTGLSALPQDDPQAIADAIMQSAIDGALDPSVSVVTDPTVTPEPDPGTDPEPGGAETTSWLSRILESIKSLPQQIAEAISSIFVPSPDFFPTAISNLRDAYSDRMGLLTYPISVLFDFLDRILNLNNQQPILRWDNIYLPWYSGRPVVAAGQYNLNDTLSTSAGRQVHEIYLVVVDAIMILAFLDLCRRKYQKIIHN